MRCEEFEVRLNEVLDDRRPLSSAGDLQAHIRQCGNCRELARSYEALLTGLSYEVVPPAPSWLAARVVRELTATVRGPKRAKLLRFPQGTAVASLAAAVLLLAVGLIWTNYSGRLASDDSGPVVGNASVAQGRGPQPDKRQIAHVAAATADKPATNGVNPQAESNAEGFTPALPAPDWSPADAQWAQDVADGLQPVTQPTVGAINGFLNLWGLGQQGHRS